MMRWLIALVGLLPAALAGRSPVADVLFGMGRSKPVDAARDLMPVGAPGYAATAYLNALYFSARVPVETRSSNPA